MTRKPNPAVVEALGRVTDFDAETIERLATVGRPINIPANWAVIVENTPADKAYIILSGTVEIQRNGTPVTFLRSGDIIGEMAILSDRLRNATVVATTPLWALHLTDEDVVELLKEDPEFANKLEAAAAARRG